jgi:hypothetical protein
MTTNKPNAFDAIAAHNTEFAVLTAAACMPSTCWGTYRRVAVVEILKGAAPKMISTRAKGVVRIVKTWEALNVGKSARCAYRRAIVEAKAIVDELNAQR